MAQGLLTGEAFGRVKVKQVLEQINRERICIRVEL